MPRRACDLCRQEIREARAKGRCAHAVAVAPRATSGARSDGREGVVLNTLSNEQLGELGIPLSFLIKIRGGEIATAEKAEFPDGSTAWLSTLREHGSLVLSVRDARGPKGEAI